jgi:C-terminal processing protease CtpA/Prc
MKPYIFLIAVLNTSLCFGQTKYEKDFHTFWNDVHAHHAYLTQQGIDWEKVNEIYQPRVKEIRNDPEFIEFLETLIHELHNGHVSLNTNLDTSNRIIPSGQDVFVQKIHDKYFITDIRKGYGADVCGLKIGDEIVLFNGKNISEQVEHFLPKSVVHHSTEMKQYAINMLFAGTHNTKRTITIHKNGNNIDYFPDSVQISEADGLIETKILNTSTAYIKINNSLGNVKTIEQFDKAIDDFMEYRNLVIDLTETPGGGNTTVARCIMGRCIKKAMPYQQHEFDEKEYQTQRSWVEYVQPRKTPFTGKVYIVVGRWTGSMGEGIAMGFDGIKNAKVIGTEMAGLLGAVENFSLPETEIGFQIPTERLYHVNGTPREKYKPKVSTKNIDETLKIINQIN